MFTWYVKLYHGQAVRDDIIILRFGGIGLLSIDKMIEDVSVDVKD